MYYINVLILGMCAVVIKKLMFEVFNYAANMERLSLIFVLNTTRDYIYRFPYGACYWMF